MQTASRPGCSADRYEFWLYRQIRKRLQSGELYLDDSLQHRRFTDELVSLDEKADALGANGHPLAAPADRCTARRPVRPNCTRNGWHSTAS